MDEFSPFPPTVRMVNAADTPTITMIMDKKIFKAKTEHLLKYHHKKEREFLKPQVRTCEYCQGQVKDQVITCHAHRLGTVNQHFKHKCRSCGFTLYDGSVIKNPRITPPPATLKGPKKGLKQAKPIQTPKGVFPSLLAASQHYNKTPGSMHHWLKTRSKDFYYI